jgi:tRNA pseudouridine55 synthase
MDILCDNDLAMLNGMFLLVKPTGITSRDLVNGVVRFMNDKKVGHTGTLDPFASGLMLVTIGKGTKMGPFLEAMDKTYEATLSFGKKTNTGDLTGEVIEEKPTIELFDDYIQQTLDTFVGTRQQIPPMFSALKQDGIPLYQLAREGKEVVRESRTIRIHQLTLLSYQNNTLTFRCHVSKGTYVRTLGEEIAEAFGMVGHLTSLIRTQIGSFDLANAKTLDTLTEKDCLPIPQALAHLPTWVLTKPEAIKAIKDGKIQTFDTEHDRLLCLDHHGEALAIYDRSEGTLFKSVRGLF